MFKYHFLCSFIIALILSSRLPPQKKSSTQHLTSKNNSLSSSPMCLNHGMDRCAAKIEKEVILNKTVNLQDDFFKNNFIYVWK